MNTCTVSACSNPLMSRQFGLCRMHYKRQKRLGDTSLPTPLTPRERFWAKVDKSGECWIWTGTLDARSGYGYFSLTHAEPRPAHRVAYEWEIGPLPKGHAMTVDHLCRNRRCVNPAHLELVTARENLLRGATLAASNAAKTECPQGHPYDAANTHIRKDGARTCRTCGTLNMRRYRAAKKAP